MILRANDISLSVFKPQQGTEGGTFKETFVKRLQRKEKTIFRVFRDFTTFYVYILTFHYHGVGLIARPITATSFVLPRDS